MAYSFEDNAKRLVPLFSANPSPSHKESYICQDDFNIFGGTYGYCNALAGSPSTSKDIIIGDANVKCLRSLAVHNRRCL